MLCAVPILGASQALFETNTWIEALLLEGQQDIPLRLAQHEPQWGYLAVGFQRSEPYH